MLIFLDGQRQVSLSSIENKMKLVLIRLCTVSLCHSVLWAKQRTGFNYVYSFLRRENANWISIFLGTILQPCNFEHLVASLKSNNSLFNKPNVPDCKVCSCHKQRHFFFLQFASELTRVLYAKSSI